MAPLFEQTLIIYVPKDYLCAISENFVGINFIYNLFRLKILKSMTNSPKIDSSSPGLRAEFSKVGDPNSFPVLSNTAQSCRPILRFMIHYALIMPSWETATK